MNEGYIPLRYAKALLEYAKLHSAALSIYIECKKSLKDFRDFSALRKLLGNPLLQKDNKKLMLATIFGGKPNEVLNQFFDLLIENKRERNIHEIIVRYIRLYREENHILSATLLTASTTDNATETRILEMIKQKTSSDIEFERTIDPTLIGGFVLELENLRWDASVSGELKKIKKTFAELNRKQSM